MALFDTTTKKKEQSAVEPGTTDKGVLAHWVLLRPRVTEKSYALNARNQYVFEVASVATKAMVRRAVEEAFGVSVVGVRMVRVAGKKRVFGGRVGRKKSFKKAIVKVAAGQSITLFKAGL